MANPEKRNIISEIGNVVFKAGVVVGILGIIGKFVSWEKLATIIKLAKKRA